MKVGDNVRITGRASFASNLDEHIGQIGVIVMHDPSDMSADSRYRVKLPTDGPFWFPETSVEPVAPYADAMIAARNGGSK